MTPLEFLQIAGIFLAGLVVRLLAFTLVLVVCALPIVAAWALLPSWQEPQARPFSMSAWRIGGEAGEAAVFLTMGKRLG